MWKYNTVAIIFIIHAIFQVFLGLDFIDGYNNDEYSISDHRHAWVGGDAYNYIINASLQTAHFVVASASFIAGILFILTGFIVEAIKGMKPQDIKE